MLGIPPSTYGVHPDASLTIFKNGQQIPQSDSKDSRLQSSVDEFMQSCNFQYEKHPDSDTPITSKDWNNFKSASYIHVRYFAPSKLQMVAGPVTLSEIKIGLSSYDVLGKSGDKVTAFHKCSGSHLMKLVEISGIGSPITKGSSGENAANN